MVYGHPPPPAPITRDSLVERLVWLDDLVRNGLDDYFRSPDDAAARAACRDLVRHYVAAVEQFLNADLGAGVSPDLPLVLMDVQVWVEDSSTGETECFVVVGPNEADPGRGRISCLSPLGMALLLRRVADTVALNAPGGRYEYRVAAIGEAPGR